MSDIADPTSWTDREREFFALGWNECLKMQPGENGRLRAALNPFARHAHCTHQIQPSSLALWCAQALNTLSDLQQNMQGPK